MKWQEREIARHYVLFFEGLMFVSRAIREKPSGESGNVKSIKKRLFSFSSLLLLLAKNR
jgi:hypothetical protein